MNKIFKVAMALREATFAGREFFLGAYSFANTKPEWQVQRVNDSAFLNWEEALQTKADGIIGIYDRQTSISRKDTGRTRVVIVNASVKKHPFHSVVSDSKEAGRRVAAHLLELRLHHFAYIGIEDVYFSDLRWQGFEEALLAAGHNDAIPSINVSISDKLAPDFSDWLKSLHRPCGILCANDGVGVKVIRMARDAGLNVPHELAIASVSNDQISCVESPVTLSSLDQDFKEVGRRAAAHLHAWMSGQRPLEKVELVSPGEMVERDSTRMSGAEDPLVSRALAIIQREFRDELTVDKVLARLGKVSRRQLELRFRETLDSSPHEEILNHRIREAQRLIRSTRYSFEEIAYQTGFYDPAHFCRQFRNRIGQTPSQYRKENFQGKHSLHA